MCEVCERGFLREKLYNAHKETCGRAGNDPDGKPSRGGVSKQWTKGRPGTGTVLKTLLLWIMYGGIVGTQIVKIVSTVYGHCY